MWYTPIDEDSGFSGSDLPVTTAITAANNMVRFDDEMLLLKALMKEVNEPIVTDQNQVLNNKINSMKANQNQTNYSAKSKNGKYELKILSQPEEQHRARYLTEGSRGAIKDKSGLGHPVVKLSGYNKSVVKIQCFIGHDKQLGSSHLFYQASKISGKNSTRCTTKKVDGTTVILMDACPENDMTVTVDCVGILKERNVDVEQKLARYKARSESESGFVAIPTKKRSTRCRLVFRAQIPETNEILQIVSSPILCTQPLGTPEICKKSLSECDVKGGVDLFIIGKNFLKDAKVIWKSQDWTKVVEPDKEFLHPTHMVCTIPAYDGPQLKTHTSIEVSLLIKSGGKNSDAHKFTYINMERVNTMSLINGRPAQIANGSAPEQLLVSGLEKPIILTMIGPTSATIAEPQLVAQKALPSSLTQIHGLNSSPQDFRLRSNSCNENTILSVISEDSLMGSPTFVSGQPQITSFNLTNGSILGNTSVQKPDICDNNSIDSKPFKTEIPMVINDSTNDSTSAAVPMVEPAPQYLPLNSFGSITSSDLVDNSSQPTLSTMAAMEPMSTISNMSCESMQTILPPMAAAPQITAISSSSPMVSSLSSTPMATISSPVQTKAVVTTQESDAMKSHIIAQNPVLTSTASTTPVTTQANNISALSEMTDAELLRFINPETFDQI